jgi:polyferredoxin
MTTKQIKFFRKLSVKLVIILLIIVPIDIFYSHWLLGHYGEGLSLFWYLYIGGINGIAIGSFFTVILSYFYDAYLDKQEFRNNFREMEIRTLRAIGFPMKEDNQETRG